MRVLRAMQDENAFGLLVSYYAVEEDEYASEDAQDFVPRFTAFTALVAEAITELPLGEGARALGLGHAVYLEIAEGEHETDPLAWLKYARAKLAENDFSTVAVLSYGSRWLADDATGSVVDEVGGVELTRFSYPSEPLRRALYADAASRPDDDDESVGWGLGLYADVDAVEALGKRPKNAPTVLRASGAQFYRAGS